MIDKDTWTKWMKELEQGQGMKNPCKELFEELEREQRQSCAEYLLENEDAVLFGASGILILSNYHEDFSVAFARIRLAQELRRRPDIALRAMMEDWGALRIVRELY